MVASGLKGGPPDVGLITFGLNVLCRSWFPVFLLPLICVLEADPGNQHFQVFLPTESNRCSQTNEQKRERRKVNDKGYLPYQQIKAELATSHYQP